MKDEVVIITGGSSGMGKYMAKNFAEKGAKVVITGRNEERLNEARKEILANRDLIVHPFVMDVREPEQVKALVEETVLKFGTIDSLVNNAAGNFIVPAEKLSINGWNAVIDIVLNGTFYCSHAVGNYWIENGKKGNILNMVRSEEHTSELQSRGHLVCRLLLEI